MHGFRDNEFLLQAEYDVIVIFLPVGASGDFFMADSERLIITS